MCVCVCVLTYICWSQSPNPSHPLSPSMLCFQSVISLKFLQQSQDILGTHTLSAPVPSVFVHLQQQTWCLWELYEVQLVLLGCGGQRRVVLTKVLVPLGASLLGHEGKKERWWVICCLANTSIFSLFLSPTSSSYKHLFSAECAQGILNLIVTCPQGESSLVESKQWVWSSIVGICETSEMGSCIRWGASWRWSSLSWV